MQILSDNNKTFGSSIKPLNLSWQFGLEAVVFTPWVGEFGQSRQKQFFVLDRFFFGFFWLWFLFCFVFLSGIKSLFTQGSSASAIQFLSVLDGNCCSLNLWWECSFGFEALWYMLIRNPYNFIHLCMEWRFYSLPQLLCRSWQSSACTCLSSFRLIWNWIWKLVSPQVHAPENAHLHQTLVKILKFLRKKQKKLFIGINSDTHGHLPFTLTVYGWKQKPVIWGPMTSEVVLKLFFYWTHMSIEEAQIIFHRLKNLDFLHLSVLLENCCSWEPNWIGQIK